MQMLITLRRLIVIASLAVACAGCFMPMTGPASMDIDSGKTLEGPDFALVKVSPNVVGVLQRYDSYGFAGAFSDRRPPPEIRFGIGDVISVTIFEASAGGLFIPAEAGVRPGNFVTLPNQNVDSAGNISVPYAGAIQAKGRTPSEVQRAIVDAIKNRAIEPQAVVALANQNTSLISVLGEVNTPSRFAANAAGERLLDVITRAGGIKGQGYETFVTLERAGHRATASFGALVYEPRNNIWAHPGDTVYVYREPQTFLAFGASGQQGQFLFEMWRITLAEGLAKAGGLLDIQADPASVYLYRREPREVAAQLGVDMSRFAEPMVPVIYSANLHDPAGYFLATKLYMHNKDVVFAANAPAVDTAKFLQFVRVVIATGSDAVVAANNARILQLNTQ